MPEATVFVTGRNEWRRHETWPPREAKVRTYFLREGGRLDDAAPSEAATRHSTNTSAIPNRPVPYVRNPAMGMRRDYMTEDQRFAATRPDVLVFETPPLADDSRWWGRSKVTLHVSTTGTDADWVVKVIDVYPGNYRARQRPIRRADRRGPRRRTRYGWAAISSWCAASRSAASSATASRSRRRSCRARPERIAFTMPDVYHTFRRGHRLMVQVQSSWFPLIDRNPQTFVDIPRARPADFVRQTHRVYRTETRPSAVELLVVE